MHNPFNLGLRTLCASFLYHLMTSITATDVRFVTEMKTEIQAGNLDRDGHHRDKLPYNQHPVKRI
eukprot:CAMPEP_0197068060 /NCGR_PEP_ID=MMETSP1384-20130603/184156_1 /TAXON_ID=29189 /ORGANISM="Ammonia sp." /LENGTH=64 /DNA_ID=CAMNT_0042505675 /DNA_START=116 /DNA_END=307 /DNA_ORIENTATION=+